MIEIFLKLFDVKFQNWKILEFKFWKLIKFNYKSIKLNRENISKFRPPIQKDSCAERHENHKNFTLYFISANDSIFVRFPRNKRKRVYRQLNFYVCSIPGEIFISKINNLKFFSLMLINSINFVNMISICMCLWDWTK